MAIHQTEIHHQEVVFSAPNLQGLRVAWGGIWSGLLFAPSAMDDVNARSFAEAYKDLMNMYVHLTGEQPP